MTTIAVNFFGPALQSPEWAVTNLRAHAKECTDPQCYLLYLADAIEAADKRVIVLDVDELHLPDILPRIIDAARNAEATRYDHAEWMWGLVRRLEDALDSLTPPRPPEPKGLGAVVDDRDGNRWVRVNSVHWTSAASPNNMQTWAELRHPVKVLSPGVDGGAS